MQAWKLVLDGHNLAGGHEVFLFPRARIWKNFIPRFRPSQQSLMDREYPYVPVFQQKSSSSPELKHEPSPQDCLCWLWAATAFYLEMSFTFIQPRFLSDMWTFLPVLCVLCLALPANIGRFSLHRVMSFTERHLAETWLRFATTQRP